MIIPAFRWRGVVRTMCARPGRPLRTGPIRWSAAALVLLVVMAACGSQSRDSTPAGTSPADQSGAFVVGFPLEPGTYEAQVFDVPLQFTVPASWKVFEDEPGQFGLAMLDNDRPCVCIWRNVYAASTTCAEEPQTGVGSSAAEITTWLTHHPGLETSEPKPVTVGGLDGFVIDVSMDPKWKKTCPFTQGTPIVMTLVGKDVSAGVHWGTDPTSQQREYILDTEPTGNIVINVEICCGVEFDQRTSDAAPVIDGLTFG